MSLNNTQLLVQLIMLVLMGAGAPIAVYNVTNWIISNCFKSPPSAFVQRWLAYGVSVGLPSALYGVIILLGQAQYDLATHIIYVLAAFGIATGIHGVRELPREPEA